MNWLQVPKVELHVHLEGAIPLPAMWELIRQRGGDPTVPDFQALQDRFHYRDFSHFIDTWGWKNQFLVQADDFRFMAQAVAQDWAAQNIRYVEAFYSPTDFGLDTQTITQAIRAGLDTVPQIEVALIVDLVRDGGPERAAITLAEAREVQDLGVIGIGIGGSEDRFPPGPFASVYEQARQWGFHTTAHAGEAAGPQSIWDAIHLLHVERIGHGTTACQDPSLVDYLAKTQIPIELCPISNVRTGVTSSYAEHPVRLYVQQGLLVTINTDDPKMFGNSLAQEFELLQTQMDFAAEDVRTLVLQGISASWLPPQRRVQLLEQFQRDPAWQLE